MPALEYVNPSSAFSDGTPEFLTIYETPEYFGDICTIWRYYVYLGRSVAVFMPLKVCSFSQVDLSIYWFVLLCYWSSFQKEWSYIPNNGEHLSLK